MNRKAREKKVLGQMFRIYCRAHHSDVAKGSLCSDCLRLLEYSCVRIDRCPQGASKTSCRKCPVHCYAPSERERIREVMRYVGPRMLFRHPLSAILHLLSELRPTRR